MKSKYTKYREKETRKNRPFKDKLITIGLILSIIVNILVIGDSLIGKMTKTITVSVEDEKQEMIAEIKALIEIDPKAAQDNAASLLEYLNRDCTAAYDLNDIQEGMIINFEEIIAAKDLQISAYKSKYGEE